MKSKITFVIVSSVFLTSCATIFNTSTTKIDVYTQQPSILVLNNDSVKTIENKAIFTVTRSKNPLTISVINDSTVDTVVVKSKLSSAYIANYLFLYGIPGAIIDFSTQKKYGYPPEIILTPEDKHKKYKRALNYNRQGELYFNFSFPYINFYHFAPEKYPVVSQEGFMSFSAGFDYYHSKNQFVNVTASYQSGFPLPFPALIDYWGEYFIPSSKHISISNNYKINRFSVGYGLCYANNNVYHGADFVSEQYENYSQHFNYVAVGTVFSSYIQLGRYFNMGFIYRPTFIRPYSHKIYRYEHLMSIDFAYKFRLKTRKSH